MTAHMAHRLRRESGRPVEVGRRRPWRAAAVVTTGAVAVLGATALPAQASHDHHGGQFRQVNLVSDVPGMARLTDPDLVNAWGLSASPGTDQAPGSPLWVSDTGADRTTLYT